MTLGENQKLRGLVQKKLAKGHSAEQIADALEEEIGIIEKIIEELMQKH